MLAALFSKQPGCEERLSNVCSAEGAEVTQRKRNGLTMGGRVREGDLAPDFTLSDQDSNAVSLADFRGEHVVVLFFYPRDFTPG